MEGGEGETERSRVGRGGVRVARKERSLVFGKWIVSRTGRRSLPEREM
jgi:hypothetical protein